jgi:hypothetical protein
MQFNTRRLQYNEGMGVEEHKALGEAISRDFTLNIITTTLGGCYPLLKFTSLFYVE